MQNHRALALFLHLVLNATYQARKVGVSGGGVVTLQRGQYITGRKRLALELKMSEKQVRTAVTLLEGLEIITKKTASKYSIITIVKYDDYQSQLPEGASKGPAKGQQGATKQEGKKETREEKTSLQAEYSDHFIEGYLKKYGSTPDPPSFAFIQLAGKIKKGVTLADFKNRCDNYFADPYVSSHSLQGLLNGWDNFIQERKRGDTFKSNKTAEGIDAPVDL